MYYLNVYFSQTLHGLFKRDLLKHLQGFYILGSFKFIIIIKHMEYIPSPQIKWVMGKHSHNSCRHLVVGKPAAVASIVHPGCRAYGRDSTRGNRDSGTWRQEGLLMSPSQPWNVGSCQVHALTVDTLTPLCLKNKPLTRHTTVPKHGMLLWKMLRGTARNISYPKW